jgi:hypothetical protein
MRGIMQANATRQALEIAGAKNERRLFPVACTRLFGPAVPPCPELCCSPPVAPAGRGHTQGFRLYSMRRYVSSLVVVGLRMGNSI